MQKKAPSIKDVAKLANVSTATVSYVVNGNRFVSEDTAAAVKRAIEVLDFRPNLTASSLRRKMSKIIGLLIPILQDDTSNIFFSQIALGVETELQPHKMAYFLGNTQENVDSEIAVIKNLVDRQIDGLILAPCLADHNFVRDLVKDIPVVYVDRKPLGVENAYCVMSDAETACFYAISEQITEGHQRIGIVHSPLNTTANVKERLNGYLRAHQQQNLTINNRLIVEGSYSLQAGYELVNSLLELDEPPTAILFTNSINALGGLQCIKDRKLRIPEDLNITVFDDYDWTRVYSPPLTVIKQNPYEMGRKAVEILMKHSVGEPTRGETFMFMPELVRRGSWCQREQG